LFINLTGGAIPQGNNMKKRGRPPTNRIKFSSTMTPDNWAWLQNMKTTHASQPSKLIDRAIELLRKEIANEK